MDVYIYNQDGLYKALTETGFLLNVWDFKKKERAIEMISTWLARDGYNCVFVDDYANDHRVKNAAIKYGFNYPGLSLLS